MTKFNFYKESMSYMQGYPKWQIWLGMPKAYIRFKRLSRTEKDS